MRRSHEIKEVLWLTDTYNTRAIAYAISIRTVTVPEEVYRGLHAKIGGAYFSSDLSADEIRLSVEHGTRLRIRK